MDLSHYIDLFIAEANEHLESLNNNLLQLEKNPDDTGILNEIFRTAHTLKGMAATMGFERITSLSHEMENALALFKNGKLAVTPEVIDLLLKCLDNLAEMLKGVEERREDTGFSPELLTALREIAASGEAAPSFSQEGSASEGEMEFNEYEKSVLNSARQSDYIPYRIKIDLAPETVMKSVRAYMVFRCLEDFGQIIKCLPPVQDLEEEKFDNSFQVVLVSRHEEREIIEALEGISEVRVGTIERLTGDDSCGASKTEDAGNKRLSGAPSVSVRSGQNSSQDNFTSHSLHLKTVRVESERLDDLMNLVGELVINKTRLEQIGSTHHLTDLLDAIEQMGRLIADLQTIVMKVRMVPVGQVFNRFPRMVRDLSRELNKDVSFIMEGEETELDRTLIDEIGEPLVHLIRNALDHGIETIEERTAKGKPATALLRLAARQEGNNVIIEVEDDGAGMDLGAIREKAVSKGFLTPKEAELLGDKEVLNVIFQPGFSTCDAVNDISGRGVGMDVVKSKIESLNGHVDIETRKGRGTKVKIVLPLTLAIIQALLVTVGEEHYAIPLNYIDETTFIFPDQIKKVQNQEVMLLRGSVLPLIRLDQRLDVPVVKKTAEDELYVVVVRKEERRVGLIVDHLIGQQEIVIKSLGSLLAGIPGIAGATILGNGQVSVILDIDSLI
ncbi:chemotaxis sensor histidine kinase CheA [Thermacetogenium phaeum DSM 12270]|uniref:Chemotaxis protein CheA n=2 Tax=Thermacetogenium phaeum TaxID=85874 RepID=K4LTG6_THEPS|nr:chemotaxis protein CheA [Thermacetogenium phaeum]AFV11329.1 chemotaxis sensor histidine kinase CheA [Thermacetogenium phaeum DSM 12270]KUK35843.1 MAG: Chemotaxis sensor histidine kinase CheA [Thermacetogenium phaeum]